MNHDIIYERQTEKLRTKAPLKNFYEQIFPQQSPIHQMNIPEVTKKANFHNGMQRHFLLFSIPV